MILYSCSRLFSSERRHCLEKASDSICFITPCLPPAIDGLGDYCRQLWRHWPSPRPDWRFLVAGGAELSARDWTDVQISQFEKSRSGLLEALSGSQANLAVLQYVGYGYDPTGRPL